MAYFPMFVDLNDEDCLIVGGGIVALRKVKVLLDFGARVHLVAKTISEEIREIEKSTDRLFLEERAFDPEEARGYKLVVVATNDNDLNERISNICKFRSIPVNVVDDKEKCSFIFPSYLKSGDVVGAFSSGGKSPYLTQYLRDKMKDSITPDIGQINDRLGEIREKIKETYPDEKERMKVLKKMFLSEVDHQKCPEVQQKYGFELQEIPSKKDE